MHKITLLFIFSVLILSGCGLDSKDTSTGLNGIHSVSQQAFNTITTQSVVTSGDITITFDPYNQAKPSVAYDIVNKNYLVLWVDDRDYSNTLTDIYARVCSATGLEQGNCDGSEIAIANSTAMETEPSVAFDRISRNYLIVWTDATHRTISGRFLNRDGSLSDVFTIENSGNPSQPFVFYSDITGRFYVLWKESNAPEIPITITGNGCQNSTVINLPEPFGDSSTIMKATVLSNGTVEDIERYSLPRIKSFSDTGNSISGSVEVQYKENNSTGVIDPLTGNLYVAWDGLAGTVNFSVQYSCPQGETPPCICDYSNITLNKGDTDSYSKIHIRRKRQSSVYDLSYGNGPASKPYVSIDPFNGKAIIVWEEDNSNDKDIKGAILDLANFTTNRLISISTASYDQTSPVAAFDPVNERYMVIWEDARNGASSTQNIDIYGQFIDSQGQLSGSNFSITRASQNQLQPAVTYGNSNFPYFFILWKDGRNGGNSDIYGNLWKYSLSPQIELTDENNQPFPSDTLNFGSAKANTTLSRVFRIWNNGNAILTISGHQGPDTPFSVTTAWPSVINPGSYYEIGVTFTPSQKGIFSSQIVINSDGGNRTLYLTGEGRAPVINVSPQSIDFGSVQAGSSSTKELTISNLGNALLVIEKIKTESPFSVENINTPLQILPGEHKSITLRFSPSGAGQYSGALVIQSDDPEKPNISVSLSGTGTSGDTDNENQKGHISCSIGGPVDKPSAIADMIVLLIPVVYLLIKSKKSTINFPAEKPLP
jgi:hypothetical protein